MNDVKIWIDTQSGTWGVCDGSLVTVVVTDALVDHFMVGASDCEISEYGLTHGEVVPPGTKHGHID